MPRFNKRHVLMLRWGAPSVFAAVVLGGALIATSRRADPAAPAPDGAIAGLTSILSRDVTPDMVRIRFDEEAFQSGLRFEHFQDRRRSLLPEDMGSGLAWGDYDDDGDPDLFLVNFAAGDDGRSVGAPCGLFRNDEGRFTDVSTDAGAALRVRGLSAAWGDFDNDDDLDLYVTCDGPNVLLRNDGGVFVEVSSAAGVDDESFSAGCAWGDFDGDGWIDLYVCNYVRFTFSDADRLRSTRQYGSEIPYTLNPSVYQPVPNRLYRNNGDGTFTDVAVAAGVSNPEGRSLGAAFFDFGDGGPPDLYVANDVSSNGVFRNNGDGTFTDIGAVSLAADYRGAMGMAVGDVDQDSDLDLFVTHWIAQENAYFENMISEGWTDAEGGPRLCFMDSADAVGLGQASLKMVGWSAGLVDLDNDGALDLWIVNGHTIEDAADHSRLIPQHVQVYRQIPPDGFFEMGRLTCAALETPVVGRGGAHADFNGDGAVDIAVLVHGGSPLLLRNSSAESGAWLGVRLRQTGRNTRALGALVHVRIGNRTQTAQVGADGSYLSQHDLDLHFGLGGAEAADEITIRWPDGATETHHNVAAGAVHRFDRVPG